jgi:hypothetical protein
MPSFSRLATHAFSMAASLLACIAFLQAQPSGGPYGPQEQRYEVPTQAGHVYFVSPEAQTGADGFSIQTPTSLENAVAQAVGGDTIILRGGIYRIGGLVTNQGITLQAYENEHPVLKGTEAAADWVPLKGGLWRTSWKKLFPSSAASWWRRDREGMKTPPHRFNNDMVFIDGKMLRSAGWEGEVDANSYYIDYEAGFVFISVDPAKHLVEITARDNAITRSIGECHGRKSDGKGFIIRGIAFTQYAYRAIEVEGKEPEGPMEPGTFGKDVVGTTLENVTISFCSRVAAFLRGDRTTLRHCLISDTSTEGVYIIGSADCLLEKNIFARNNIEQITGYFPSAVKIFNQSHRVVCRDNLVMDQPYSNGIWYDVGNRDGVFINNWVQNAQAGFFFEISKNAICAGNVFVDCEQGVYVLNSCNVRVFNNTFVNTEATFERTERSAVGDHFGWHPATGPDVDKRDGHVFANNLIVVDSDYPKGLLLFKQSKALNGKLTGSQAALVDGNVYVRRGDKRTQPLIQWSPSASETFTTECTTLEQFRKLVPSFEASGLYLQGGTGAVFRCAEMRNFELQLSLPSGAAGVPLPEEIRMLLNWPSQTQRSPGAYQH